jgi:hypothetical protein
LPTELELNTLQVAEHYGVLPDAVEQMDVYWFNRTLLHLKAKAAAQKED